MTQARKEGQEKEGKLSRLSAYKGATKLSQEGQVLFGAQPQAGQTQPEPWHMGTNRRTGPSNEGKQEAMTVAHP